MIYTTLKANKEHGIDMTDIALQCDESYCLVADLFENSEKYYWNGRTDSTDFDKLYEDYTERQVASAVLKYLKQEAKDKEGYLLNYAPLKIFLDLDCDGEIAYDLLEDLIKDGEITGAGMLKDIEKKAGRKGRTIKKGYYYGKNDIYYGEHDIDDLIEEHFPCKEEMFIDEDGDECYRCSGCGNCH